MSISQNRITAALFIAGFLLMILQFFMIREISAILRGTELVILLVTVSYFAGYSVGYWISGWFTLARIRIFAVIFWLIHITLPFSLRYLSAILHEKSAGASFAFVVFAAIFLLSSFYSVLLPWFLDKSGASHSLARLYGAELAGALFGAIGALALGGIPMALPAMYQGFLALLIYLLWPGRILGAALVLAVAGYCASYQALERHSLTQHYVKSLHFPQAEPLLSVSSPYQKVDFIRSGITGNTYIFLDGNMNFGSTSLEFFNAYLSLLPARLLHPQETLIIGAGSLQSLRHTAPLSGHVDVVEIDGAIVEGSKRYLREVNRLDSISNWSLTIADAKNYLGSAGKKYDLIIVDVPAPFTIQVGLLHSMEFYALAKGRLKSQGVLSISLSGTFSEDALTPRTVAAGALAVFPQAFLTVPDIPGRSFIMAGESLPFGRAEVEAECARLSDKKTAVYDKTQAMAMLGDAQAISLNNPGHPVKRSWNFLLGRYITGKLP